MTHLRPQKRWSKSDRKMRHYRMRAGWRERRGWHYRGRLSVAEGRSGPYAVRTGREAWRVRPYRLPAGRPKGGMRRYPVWAGRRECRTGHYAVMALRAERRGWPYAVRARAAVCGMRAYPVMTAGRKGRKRGKRTGRKRRILPIEGDRGRADGAEPEAGRTEPGGGSGGMLTPAGARALPRGARGGGTHSGVSDPSPSSRTAMLGRAAVVCGVAAARSSPPQRVTRKNRKGATRFMPPRVGSENISRICAGELRRAGRIAPYRSEGGWMGEVFGKRRMHFSPAGLVSSIAVSPRSCQKKICPSRVARAPSQ